MKKISALLMAGLLAAAVSAPAMADDEAETQKAAQQCLMCHGSFDAIREKTKNWKDEFDSPVNPHQYIDGKNAKPHQGAKVLPDCKGCHGQHPLPLPKGYQHKMATVSTCYGCHHEENFKKCSECHNDK